MAPPGGRPAWFDHRRPGAGTGPRPAQGAAELRVGPEDADAIFVLAKSAAADRGWPRAALCSRPAVKARTSCPPPSRTSVDTRYEQHLQVGPSWPFTAIEAACATRFGHHGSRRDTVRPFADSASPVPRRRSRVATATLGARGTGVPFGLKTECRRVRRDRASPAAEDADLAGVRSPRRLPPAVWSSPSGSIAASAAGPTRPPAGRAWVGPRRRGAMRVPVRRSGRVARAPGGPAPPVGPCPPARFTAGRGGA